jgi:hypothetical protein
MDPHLIDPEEFMQFYPELTWCVATARKTSPA